MDKENFLRSTIENLTQYYYDSLVQKCAEERQLIGVKSLITRQQLGMCCAWCQRLVGTYEYAIGKYSEDIFRRHQNCRCMVTVKTDRSGYTDVWSKKTYETRRDAVQARIEELEQEAPGMDDLVKEYFRNADPGKGIVHVEDGFEPDDDTDRVMSMAEWLHNTLGGNLEILKRDEKIRTPDYLWRGKYWDLKTVKDENAARSALGSGMGQIFLRGNAGGVIMNFGNYSPDMDELWKSIQKKLSYYGIIPEDFDVMIVSNHTLVKIFRISKKIKK